MTVKLWSMTIQMPVTLWITPPNDQLTGSLQCWKATSFQSSLPEKVLKKHSLKEREMFRGKVESRVVVRIGVVTKWVTRRKQKVKWKKAWHTRLFELLKDFRTLLRVQQGFGNWIHSAFSKASVTIDYHLQTSACPRFPGILFKDKDIGVSPTSEPPPSEISTSACSRIYSFLLLKAQAS